MNQVIAKPKVRESNFELLRIIAMFMVLILHADFQALGAPTRADIISSPIASTLKVFFEMASIVAVNVFILISGWFGIRPSVKGFCKFAFQCLFFAIGIYVVMILLGKEIFTLRGVANCLAIINGGSYWFIPSYICLYLFAPVLNSFVKIADKRTFFCVLAAFYTFQTIYSFIGGGGGFLMKGYSALSFMGLYLLSAFVRKHIDLNKVSRQAFSIGYIAVTIALTAIWLMVNVLNLGAIESRLVAYSNPLVVLSSLLLLITFSKIRCRSDIVNKVAASCFAVYLLHCHPSLYAVYLDSVVGSSNSNMLHLIGVIVLWYLLSILLDFVRAALYMFMQRIIKCSL